MVLFSFAVLRQFQICSVAEVCFLWPVLQANRLLKKQWNLVIDPEISSDAQVYLFLLESCDPAFEKCTKEGFFAKCKPLIELLDLPEYARIEGSIEIWQKTAIAPFGCLNNKKNQWHIKEVDYVALQKGNIAFDSKP